MCRLAHPFLTLLPALALATACGREPGTEDPLDAMRRAEVERLAALSEAGSVPPPTRGYLVISFDTLRADHLGVYGYRRDTSPFFDDLAARGTVFDNAVVQYPSTLTSHMSIFTGLYPAEHGVLPPDSVLSPDIETFPEVFQRAGFKTAGYTEGGFMRGRFGFRRGFDDFRARDRQSPREIEHTFARGVRFLESLGPEDRFLLFLHTYAVHAPYEPPEGYRDLFQEDFPDGPPPGAFPPTGPQLVRVNAEQKRLSPEVIAYFEALYDATVRYADDTLRNLFGELERLSLDDEVTVILTSDHGEEFQEHGLLNHTQLYQEVMRVPLVVVHPGVGPGRYEPMVESVDLAPTLYELAGLRPTGRPSGVSVARVLGTTVEAGRGLGRTLAYAENGGKQKALWRRTGTSLLHLLTFDLSPDRWFPRRLLVDAAKEELTFEARSYEGSQTLTLTAVEPGGDGGKEARARPLRSVAVGPEWTPVRAELPPLPEGRAKHRLELEGERCTVPEEVRKLRLWRCHGFQVRGLPLGRVELYDLLEDPRERRDLSYRRDAPTRPLLRFLRELRFLPRAAAGREELDEEAERNLRALGYLQ
jgi:arylsulfatase A-like enzyme